MIPRHITKSIKYPFAEEYDDPNDYADAVGRYWAEAYRMALEDRLNEKPRWARWWYRIWWS